MPVVRAPLDPENSLWSWLAYELRAQRERHGLSLTQVGRLIHAARSTVCNIEAGRARINEDQVKILDARYGTGRTLELVLYFARLGHDPDWFRQYTQYEATSSIIRVYAGQGIPMPLQTDLYTRSLVSEHSLGDRETELKSRILRRDLILERADPPYVWALLDEAALELEVGGVSTLITQLEYLLCLAERANVCTRVIPKSAGAHLGTDGAFRVISMKGRDIAYAGAYRGGRLIESPAEVREVVIDYERISQKALSERDTCALIERKLEWYRCVQSGGRVPTAEW
ncbi:helix-turn-helix protein [Actinocorallia herbida]|uniref:Helix-turn-helix protein n=1 Tax=Actinocorallia herbida TaxID=58109 RepID=A0A3N1D7X6_9ACTN|nr:helix-turn-helix transcriptional regulator [Actinocorallia herbida]ROO89643.1 helix-turn-helix protein [Actinocorallia herbida]